MTSNPLGCLKKIYKHDAAYWSYNRFDETIIQKSEDGIRGIGHSYLTLKTILSGSSHRLQIPCLPFTLGEDEVDKGTTLAVRSVSICSESVSAWFLV